MTNFLLCQEVHIEFSLGRVIDIYRGTKVCTPLVWALPWLDTTRTQSELRSSQINFNQSSKLQLFSASVITLPPLLRRSTMPESPRPARGPRAGRASPRPPSATLGHSRPPSIAFGHLRLPLASFGSYRPPSATRPSHSILSVRNRWCF